MALIDALTAGVGIKAACEFAWINEQEFEDFCRMDESIAELARLAESRVGTQATINIVKAINDGDVKVSKWYKEHTDRRFAKNQGIQIEAPVVLSVEDKEKELASFLEGFGKAEDED